MASTAEEARARGNAAYSAGNFTEAVKHYTEAIALSPSNQLNVQHQQQHDQHWVLENQLINTQQQQQQPLSMNQYNIQQQQRQQQQCKYQHQHQVLPTKSLFEKELNVQQQQQLTNELLMQQQMWKNQLLGQQQSTSDAVNGDVKAIQCDRVEQMLGSGYLASTFLPTDLAADASTSNGVRTSPRQPQNLVSGEFDLPGDLPKLTEQPSNIWADNVQALWTPQAKACHTNMASLDIASEAIAMQGQGLQASLGAYESFKRTQKDLEKAEAKHKKQKEANDTLTRKNVELKESLNALQTRVKELENGMSKMSEDHAQLNVEVKARIEMLEEFVARKHVAWNPSEERVLFLKAYPPIQTKEKDAPVREIEQPAQDVDKETVEFEGEETFLLV